jgi:hypothetical protein
MLIVGVLPNSIFAWSGATDRGSDLSVRWLAGLAPVPIIALDALVAPLVGYGGSGLDLDAYQSNAQRACPRPRWQIAGSSRTRPNPRCIASCQR